MNAATLGKRGECVGSERETNGIRVTVSPRYKGERQDRDLRVRVFTYRIRIENRGELAAQLLSRHWVILDANGKRHEARGGGVVGQYPRLEPGAAHVYESECPMATAWGTMEGAYEFERDTGERFRAEIGRFILVSPPA